MSYSAWGNGYIEFKDKKEACEKLKTRFSEELSSLICTEDNPYEILSALTDFRFYDDNSFNFSCEWWSTADKALEFIAPLVTENSCIEIHNDWGEHNIYEYKNGKLEITGSEVVFDLDNFSDTDLTKELEKRGYFVVKPNPLYCKNKFNDSITVGQLEEYPNKGISLGGFVQINNLLVEVKVSDDNQGYIVDIFNNDKEELIDSVAVWKIDLENDEED